MTDTNDSTSAICENVEKNEVSEKETTDTPSVKEEPDESAEKEIASEVSDTVKKETEEVVAEVKPEEEAPKESMGSLFAAPEPAKSSPEPSEAEKPKNEESATEETNATEETPVDEFVQPSSVPKVSEKDNVNSSAAKESAPAEKKPESFTDSSLSSCSEVQSSAPPFESSCSSQENSSAGRINFENAIKNESWKEENSSGGISELVSTVPPVQEESKPVPDTPLITIDENTETSAPPPEAPSVDNVEMPSFPAAGFAPPVSTTQDQIMDDQADVKPIEPIELREPSPEPVPTPPPMPRKRGRPRKQVLPNPSPIVESWGPNAQEFPSMEGSTRKRPRGDRRPPKRKGFDDDDDNLDDDGRRRYKSSIKKKKRRMNFTPKRRLPPPRRKHSEYEDFQNFEEETRMSASEGHGMYSSRGGFTGDESQGSSFMDGHTRGSVNKKGRMEVMIDGCKPVTVNQIVEYFWPPPSSLPFGEKPDGLMIQEQISEYLGVKSFKRKYPSIKRRPVDMEERNYLQENGFVSENMCDMGLTAVFSADILEIMYNDFPQKFEEYRKYSREKKAREQRALREKQAAERADMDPKKEAIEAALSWNSEFNKTRRSNYNSKVLMGNWFDQNCNDEQQLAMYLKKKERGQLLTIGVRRLFENFLRHVPLSLPTKGLAYGGVIQLLAPDVVSAPSHAAEKPTNGLCLAVTIDSNDIDRTQTIVQNLAVVGSPLKEPCARNAFVIESDEGKAPGQAVCYGDTFYLKSVGRDDVSLYVELPIPGLSTPTGRCGFPTPKLRLCRGHDSRFKVLHVRTDLRFTTDGLPCPPFERVIINHAPNNAALCVENEYWKMSLFSYESEICANTKLDLRKQYTSPNLWMFVVGSSK